MTKETNAPEAGVMDFASLDTVAASDEGARINILHPVSKEPTALFIRVLGKHSTTFRELVRERINSNVRQQALAQKRGKVLDPKTAEEVEREALQMLVACTIGWDTEIYEGEGKERKVKETKPEMFFNGQWLPFNAQNAMLVYTKLLWLREQVDDGIGDLENFIKA